MANTYRSQDRPKNIALQEKAVEEAQRKLNRIEKMREEMARQVQLEMQRLDEMRRQASDFTRSNADSLTNPSLSSSAPNGFQSQFDQFHTKSASKLVPTDKRGVDIDMPYSPTGQQANNISAGNKTGIDNKPHETVNGNPLQNQSFYRDSDRDEHFTTLASDPGTGIYVSGYYYSSGQGSKRYEYQLGSSQLPINVGDMVKAPVHSSGHNDGLFLKGHDRRFIITDIYTKKKFEPYHDVIW